MTSVCFCSKYKPVSGSLPQPLSLCTWRLGLGLALGLEEALEVGSQRDRARAGWLEAPEGQVEKCKGAREAEEKGTQRQDLFAGKTLGGKWARSSLGQGRGPVRLLQS